MILCGLFIILANDDVSEHNTIDQNSKFMKKRNDENEAIKKVGVDLLPMKWTTSLVSFLAWLKADHRRCIFSIER